MFRNKLAVTDDRTLLKYPFNPDIDHFTGPLEAPVEIVLYAGFQCRHCGDAYLALRRLRGSLGSHLKIVFRHFPLPALHPLALEAAVATEAAALQQKFWEMHDIIFECQRFLVKSSFSKFAEKLALDMALFNYPVGYKALVQKVLDDFQSGLKCGVDSTPTLFINGFNYNGFMDAESLYDTCNGLMGKKKLLYVAS